MSTVQYSRGEINVTLILVCQTRVSEVFLMEAETGSPRLTSEFCSYGVNLLGLCRKANSNTVDK